LPIRLALSIDFSRSIGLKVPIEIGALFIAYRAQLEERWISASIVASTSSASELIESGSSFRRAENSVAYLATGLFRRLHPSVHRLAGDGAVCQ
jgi:hypothetical protein